MRRVHVGRGSFIVLRRSAAPAIQDDSAASLARTTTWPSFKLAPLVNVTIPDLMETDLLGIGLTGKTLTSLERTILRDSTPYGVVLFGRNIAGPEQLRDLVAEVKAIARIPPLFMIDEEGGRVDRLRQLLPGLPSAEAFGEGRADRSFKPSQLVLTGFVEVLKTVLGMRGVC